MHVKARKKPVQSKASERAAPRRVGRPRHEVPSESYFQQRGSILRKAAQLLEQSSYQELSLARVAVALDLSKAGMYYYFKSKHHLLYVLYENYLDEQYERMSQVLTIADSKQRTLAMIRCQIDGILANLQLIRLRLSHFPFIDDPIVERCLRKELRHTSRLGNVVESAIADGHLPQIDPFLLTELLFGMPLLVYRSHSVSEYSPSFIEAQIAKLFRLA